MARTLSFDTQLDSDFKLSKAQDVEFVGAFVTKLREQSLAANLPAACGRYWFDSDYIAVVPSFLCEHTDWLTHFELYNGDGGWFWGVHFESKQILSLKTWNQATNRVKFEASYKSYALLDCFHDLFPVDEKSKQYGWCKWKTVEHGCLFWKQYPIKSFAEAITTFNDFYKFVVETMDKADIDDIRKKHPEAASVFDSLRLLTQAEIWL